MRGNERTAEMWAEVWDLCRLSREVNDAKVWREGPVDLEQKRRLPEREGADELRAAGSPRERPEAQG